MVVCRTWVLCVEIVLVSTWNLTLDRSIAVSLSHHNPSHHIIDLHHRKASIMPIRSNSSQDTARAFAEAFAQFGNHQDQEEQQEEEEEEEEQQEEEEEEKEQDKEEEKEQDKEEEEKEQVENTCPLS
jgi:outer membrane biosynthesis protein TonB